MDDDAPVLRRRDVIRQPAPVCVMSCRSAIILQNISKFMKGFPLEHFVYQNM